MSFQGGRMKDYIWQFYNEGFGSIFYVKPINYLKKKIKNKQLFKLITTLIKIMYTLIFIFLGIFILYYKLK